MEYAKVNQDDLVKDLFDKVKGATENIVRPNILVCGKSGVGKSTLINSVFRKELAETGIGHPVTKHLQTYTDPEVPINLYDTKGLELSGEVQKQIREEIIGFVNKSRESGNAEDYIHVIWYCINSTSNRIEPIEEEMIKELSTSVEIPVIIVLTQSLLTKKAKEFQKSIEEMNLVRNVISVMAQESEVSEGVMVPPHGLDKLVEVTYSWLPKSVQHGFINAQKINLSAKEKTAKKYANAYIASTFVAGFIPIPCSDMPVLIGQQVTMIAHITSIFGLSIDKSFLSATVSSIFGSGIASVAGKFVVSNILKHIPGIGTVAGGLVSGATAALLTAAMARAYIAFLVEVVKKENEGKALENKEVFDGLSDMFKNEIKKGSIKV